ncbi:hypothetical protein LTR41_006299 [Exophiala xenobiotica]|nr:hypothetical protein LTR41_006299 [Exophiala xenobiotica]KAK5404204.1 hypothetical protein LTR06_010137 [Exophiala xenobiotica]
MDSLGAEFESSSDISAKRKQPSQAGETDRIVKRRSARACQSCRRRKVRCDILVDGVRCTNCKLDDLKCILSISKRGKSDKSQKGSPGWPPASVRPPSSNDTIMLPTGSLDIEEERPEPTMGSPTSTAATAHDVPVCLTFDDEDVRDRLERDSGRDYRFDASEAPSEWSPTQYHHQRRPQGANMAHTNTGQLPQSLSAISVPDSASTGYCTADAALELHLPSFINPIPKDMDPEDVRFLARKGAFILPTPELRMEILRGYLFSVHPFMPILDANDFVGAVLSKDSGGKVSLLLFQAVMFAGLASLNTANVPQTGCKTVKQARKSFFTKVHLLHDFNIEPDNIVVLQSQLLMSLWYEKWNDQRHTWHWTGLGLSLAHSIGLHRGGNVSGLPQKVQRLRRRLWWSLYIRDRLIALGTRRPMRIKDEEHNVPLLTVDDFDIEPFEALSKDLVAGWPVVGDVSQNRCLALMCIELTKLCTCIGQMLSSQYTILGERSSLTNTLMVVPRDPSEREKELLHCDQKLEDWYQNLDHEIRLAARDTARGISTSSQGIHWSILIMIHLTAVSVLHRPQVLQPCASGSDLAQGQNLSKEKVKGAARKVTKMLHTMLRRDQVRFLPTSGVPALLWASLAHMLEVKSKDEDVRDASILRYYHTIQVLQRLREIYASADSAVLFLASAVRKAGISIPIQLDAQAAPEFMIATTSIETVGQTVLLGRGSLSSSLPMQAEMLVDKNMQLQEDQIDSQADSIAGPRRTRTENPQASAVLRPYHGSVLGSNIVPAETSSNQLSGADTSGASTWGDLDFTTSSHAQIGGAMKRTGYEQSQDMNSSALEDPLSYWAWSDDYFNVGSSLDHFMNEEAIALGHAFCSGAFGLFDGLEHDIEDNETITVNRPAAD